MYKKDRKVYKKEDRIESARDNPFQNNDQYEGFCIDLLRHVAEICKFKFQIHEVVDSNYGSMVGDGEWNGLVGELQRNVCLSTSSDKANNVEFHK